MRRWRAGGIDFAEIRHPACHAMVQIVLSETTEVRRMFCKPCSTHWDQSLWGGLSVTWRDTDSWCLPWVRSTHSVLNNPLKLGFEYKNAVDLAYGLPHEGNSK